MSNSFDLNILVNGNRCKQYYYNGRTYVEAKNGSEYVIEIKNNHYKRVLAVTSVDGLNVLTGKSATPDDTGYIIGAYSSEKIKGFRFSDNEWAMFRFGYKFYGNTYAQSKGGDAEKNCGIVGMKIFYEKEPVYTYVAPQWNPVPWNPSPWNPSWTCCSISASYSGGGGSSWSAGYVGTGAYQSNVNYTCGDTGRFNLQNMTQDYYCSPGVSTREKDQSYKCSAKPRRSKGGGTSAMNYCADSVPVAAASVGGLYGRGRYGYEEPKANFDMGTEWGRKENSRVETVTFDRGCLAQTFDIYYASREALISMGVPIYSALSTNLPESFPDKYAQPPKDWVG